MTRLRRSRQTSETRWFDLWILLALLTAIAACTPQRAQMHEIAREITRERQSQAQLPQVELCIRDRQKGVSLVAEKATTPRQRRIGLMGRETLAPDAGMLFVYERENGPNASFWMYQTLIPLDIAYLDAEGEILAIQSMPPCNAKRGSACPTYPAGVTYRAALEVNRGFFERQNITPGARITEATSEECKGTR